MNHTREAILERAAAELVESAGQTLTLRKIAADADTTTQAIYTLFGGKQGVVTALYEEGWRRLASRLKVLETSPHPLQALCDIGACYISFARENEHFYALMIGRSIGSVSVPGREIRHAATWEKITRVAITRALDAGYLSGAVEDIGRLLWASAHGYIDLALNGFLAADNDAPFLAHAAVGVFSTFAGPEFKKAKLVDGVWVD